MPKWSVFRQALKIIKLWAQQRCIYSNVLGYLGGIGQLVANICQQYPLSNASQIVINFFNIYRERLSNINPEPIQLNIDAINDENNIEFNQRINKLEGKGQFLDLMPIITPIRPHINCAHNVIETTKNRIINQINRACNIIASDMPNK